MPHFIVLLLLSLTVNYSSYAYTELEEIPAPIKSRVSLPQVDVDSWILADYYTGWVLGGKNIHKKIEPASLTKLMTSYLVFEAITNGEIKLEETTRVSKKAWQTGGSRMFIQVDTEVSVENLMKGLIIQSGNDAAVALAEHVSGSEDSFADKMNLAAESIGMENSHFTNSHGLPDDNHYSTVHDIVLLSMDMIRRFPDLYSLYSVEEFTYNDITQQNRNLLLYRDETVDGLKTGYTQKAGYCLVGSALRGDMRLTAAVVGAKNKTVRADQVQSLLQFGFSEYDALELYTGQSTVKTLPLWKGNNDSTDIGVNESLGVIYPKGDKDKLSALLNLPDSLEAPLESGLEVGSITVKYDGDALFTAPLYNKSNQEEGAWWSQLLDSLKQLIY